MDPRPVRAEAGWLALREPADAAARSEDLVAALPWRGGAIPEPAVVHDLGGGTGAMARWLGPRLPGAQRWVVHDRDQDLLAHLAERPPGRALDGAPVTVTGRGGDLTRLDPADLAGAALVTASALLDMLTGPELDRLLDLVTRARRPALLALSVTGEVLLDPPDPLDAAVGRAFDEHQHRPAAEGPRLGPDAWWVAAEGFRARGYAVTTEATPWRLGPESGGLVRAWLDGWVAAAREQRPALAGMLEGYVERRGAQLEEGRLRVVVGHRDLLALPGESS